MRTIFQLAVATMILGSSLALADGRLAVRRIGKDGTCNLVFTQTNSSARITFEALRLLQYLPDRAEWIDRTEEIPSEEKAREIGTGKVAVLGPITRRVGLFWLEWKEDGQTHSAFVHSGPVLCNDIEIGPPPKPDLIAQCVPGTNSARAVFVRDPRKLKRTGKE